MALQARVPLGDVTNGLNQARNGSKAFAVKPLLSGNEKRRRDPSPRRLSSGRDRRSQGKAPVAKPRQARDDDRRRDRLRKRDGMSMGPVQDCLVPSLGGSMNGSMNGMMMYEPVYSDFEYPYSMPGNMQCQFLEDMSCPQVWSWDPCLEQTMAAPEYAFQQPRQPEVREERRLEKEDALLYPGHPAYNPIDVTVKNTFIDLPAPRTPSPNSLRNAKTPVANTCPPKYAMGAEMREQWEHMRLDAEEAAALFEGKERAKAAPNFDETTSVGSLLHRAGLCKPCAWFHHAKGCQRGVRCEFCHCCPPGEIKKRKKEKTVLIRKRRTQHGYTDDYAKACPLVPQYELPQCW